MRMDSRGAFGARSGLRKHAGAVSKRISNGSSELPEYLAEGFLEVMVDNHMLIITKSRRRKLGEGGNAQVGVLIPALGHRVLAGR